MLLVTSRISCYLEVAMNAWPKLFQVVVLGQTLSSPLSLFLREGLHSVFESWDKVWESTLCGVLGGSVEDSKFPFSWCSFLFLVFSLHGKTWSLWAFRSVQDWGARPGEGPWARNGSQLLRGGLFWALREKDGRRSGVVLETEMRTTVTWHLADRSEKVLTVVDHW